MGNVTSEGYNVINAILKASLLLNVHIMQSNTLHVTLNPFIIYICSVNILCSEYNTLDVKLSVIMVCLPAMFELSGAEKTCENRLCHR